MRPSCRTTTRMIGKKSPSWRLFADGGFKRQADGCELVAWELPPFPHDNFVRILCGPVMCDPRHPAFLGASSCSNSTAELTGFAEALKWTESHVQRVLILFDSRHSARFAVSVAHAGRNIALAEKRNDLVLVQGHVKSLSIMFLVMFAKPGTLVLTVPPPWV